MPESWFLGGDAGGRGGADMGKKWEKVVEKGEKWSKVGN